MRNNSHIVTRNFFCTRARSAGTATFFLIIAAGLFGWIASAAPSGKERQPHDLVELVALDPTIKLDIRYATSRNFTGRVLYPQARAFLQRRAAEALLEAHSWLKTQGFGLIVYDAYRPWSVSKIFWELTPPAKRKFVANPSKGSGHNRGCAADVGLFELRSGRELEMPSPYDEMSGRSSMSYTGGTAGQRANRDLLRKAMERKGQFKVYPPEWWHFTYRNCREYAILDVPFSAIVPTGGRP